MCSILMSINPKYVEKILSGNKKYEYRKIKARNKNVNKIVIYATFPVMKIVAEVNIEEILEDSPRILWEKTKKYSGVTKDFFEKYYDKKKTAVAYKLGKVTKYDKPMELKDFGISCAPQSFIYLS